MMPMAALYGMPGHPYGPAMSMPGKQPTNHALLIIFHQADIQCLSRLYLEQQQSAVLVQSPRCRVTVGRLGDMATMEASEGMGREGVRYQEKLVIFSNFIGTENNKQIATCE